MTNEELNDFKKQVLEAQLKEQKAHNQKMREAYERRNNEAKQRWEEDREWKCAALAQELARLDRIIQLIENEK